MTKDNPRITWHWKPLTDGEGREDKENAFPRYLGEIRDDKGVERGDSTKGTERKGLERKGGREPVVRV